MKPKKASSNDKIQNKFKSPKKFLRNEDKFMADTYEI